MWTVSNLCFNLTGFVFTLMLKQSSQYLWVFSQYLLVILGSNNKLQFSVQKWIKVINNEACTVHFSWVKIRLRMMNVEEPVHQRVNAKEHIYSSEHSWIKHIQVSKMTFKNIFYYFPCYIFVGIEPSPTFLFLLPHFTLCTMHPLILQWYSSSVTITVSKRTSKEENWGRQIFLK